MDSIAALLALMRAPIRPGLATALMDAHGDAAAALRAGPPAWRAAGIRGPALAALARPDHAAIEADRRWLAGPERRLLAWGEADYPWLLRKIEAAPAGLFLEGDASLLWHPQIAVVGSRRPTPVGADNARRFAGELAAAGWVVTSGLAEGIDAHAHQAALAKGRTIAVIGTGPDSSYPAAHAGLMAKIAAQGLVVSEYPPGTLPRQSHFPARNRLIAGLSLGTLVVEAALRSGALITARLAADAGREVFALPGSIHNPLAQGCHRLIRQGAALVESPAEVIEGLAGMALSLAEGLRQQLPGPVVAADAPPSGTVAADADEPRLLAVMGFEPVPLDVLADRSGLTLPRLSAILLGMELDGRIRADNGRYSRLA